MAEFLSDPSVLTKDKLKSALVANNVALPNGDQRKGVYVELYLKNLTSQNKRSGSAEAFSSDEEPPTSAASITARSGRKASRKTDRVRPEEIDVIELTNEELKEQLLKYGIIAGPIVASTRTVYEKKLQKLLDQGPPQTTIITTTEPLETLNSQNRNTDSDQYSDKEEEAITVPDLEPEPEPVPVVERPLRSRGKTPVTNRTRSSQHKVMVSETLPVPQEKKRFSAIPKDPKPLIANTLLIYPSVSPDGSLDSPERRSTPSHTAGERYHGDYSTHKFSDSAEILSKVSAEEVHLSVLDTALFEVDPRDISSSRPANVASFLELKSTSSLKRTTRPDSPHVASTQPSRDPIHVTCRPSLSSTCHGKDFPCSVSLMDSPRSPIRDLPVTMSSPIIKEQLGASSAAVLRQINGFLPSVTPVRGQNGGLGEQTSGAPIEKLSAVEQTPKTSERDLLKELFPNEVLNTPTGISATRRQPIKGAAGRPFSDSWHESLRPRLTEHRYTTSSYTESRSVPRISTTPLMSVPLSAPKPAAPPSVQTKATRKVPVWVQLLLLAAVVCFLLFVFQAMESNQTSPFDQPGVSDGLKKTSVVLVEMYSSGLKSSSRVNLFHSPLISLTQQQGGEQRHRSLTAASYHEADVSCQYGSKKYYALCGFGGILSCGLTHTAVVPLDLIKCRIQVNPDKYKSILNGFSVTLREDGFRGLGRGWAPTFLGYSMQGLCKFGFYELFKSLYNDLLGEENAYLWRTSVYLVASASAEFFADVALAPMEACKVRIQTRPGYARTLRECFPKMYAEEGLWAFYKGVYPLWLRQIPYTMMKFACFERTVEILYKYVVPKPRNTCSKAEQLIVTFVAGYIALSMNFSDPLPAEKRCQTDRRASRSPAAGQSERMPSFRICESAPRVHVIFRH
ncbi:Phosphate carrier protein, mitochondrial [Bagarius yarrelli]|uniref:Solute carrier family 25 member 3 n=1 Tax=Bagarius yarrelli TaxID=175774 RepID=A0A556V3D0_BAGYA|nr:Phosphate carrier protein, mitochondrial [Bagarius yarrelli]